MATHWHCENGLTGYGPDASDNGFTIFETLSDALEAAREELNIFADMAYDSAQGFAEQEDYKEAWKELKRSEALEMLRANLDTKRQSAPLYAGNPQAWQAEQERLADEFPLEVSYNSTLYLWQCDYDCTEDED